MKRKNSITQKRVLEKRLQQGQDNAIIKYGLDQEELQMAITIAAQTTISFDLIKAILAAYHTASVNTAHALVNHEVQQVLTYTLDQQQEQETPTGLFQ